MKPKAVPAIDRSLPSLMAFRILLLIRKTSQIMNWSAYTMNCELSFCQLPIDTVLWVSDRNVLYPIASSSSDMQLLEPYFDKQHIKDAFLDQLTSSRKDWWYDYWSYYKGSTFAIISTVSESKWHASCIALPTGIWSANETYSSDSIIHLHPKQHVTS